MSKPPEPAPPPDCPLCRGHEARRLVTRSGYPVVRCTRCGLVFVWPPPSPGELEAFYAARGYHAEVDAAERCRTFAARLRRIEEHLPRRGRVLDVGCAQGHFLQVARDEGWDAVGLDVDPQAVEAARARGLAVRQGELEPGTFPPACFDVVTLFDLIEHVRAPRRLLAACRRVLRAQGLLVVTTPDVSGLVPRATYALFGLPLGAWGHPTPPGHLVQFSRRTLLRLLREEGFQPIAVRREHIPIAYSVGKLENAALEVLAGRHRTRPVPGDAREGEPAGGRPGRGSLARAAVRRLVCALCWAVVGAAGGAARATGWGDSLWVVARAAEQGDAGTP